MYVLRNKQIELNFQFSSLPILPVNLFANRVHNMYNWYHDRNKLESLGMGMEPLVPTWN